MLWFDFEDKYFNFRLGSPYGFCSRDQLEQRKSFLRKYKISEKHFYFILNKKDYLKWKMGLSE